MSYEFYIFFTFHVDVCTKQKIYKKNTIIYSRYFPRCQHALALEEERRTTEFSPPDSPPSYTPPIQSPAVANIPQS